VGLEGYLTTKEAAKRADPPVSDVRVRQACLEGKMPNAFKVGYTWLIPVEDFEKWSRDPARLHWKQSREREAG